MNYNWKKRSTFLLIIIAMILGRQAFATELQGVKWKSGSSPATLALTLDGSTQPTTQSLDNGQRLRLVLPDTRLAKGVSDIPGEGLVKSVFPFVGKDGKSVNVDLLMKQPGHLEVTRTDHGLDLVAMNGAGSSSQAAGSSGSVIPPSGGAQQGTAPQNNSPNELKGITFASLPGGRVQVNLTMAHKPRPPGHFATNEPPRLAFDFFNTRSQLKSPVTKVGIGAVQSITTVQAEDRTRVVFNLIHSVPYQTQITDKGMVFVIQNPDIEAARVERTTPKPFARKTKAKHSIKNIDFRRAKNGGGRITVKLSDPDVGVDVRQQDGQIIADFPNTEISKDLEQRLDVTDFATPVQTIDTFQEGDEVRMVITPEGHYQHLAYQSGDVFNINVDPILHVEKGKKKNQRYTGQRLSLNFQKINVRAALQVIADFTGLNFVTSDSVTGTLTLRLKDVPWDQALDIILQTRGLGMRRSGNVVWVAPAGEIRKREQEQLQAQKDKSNLEPLVSELIQINYAKASDIASILKSVKAVNTGVHQSLFGSVNISQVKTERNSLLSSRGSVTVDDRTNSILIQDTASKIAQVRKLIAKLDKPVKQVLIETRIVEATANFARNLGARLGFQRVVQRSDLGNADVTSSGTLEGAASTAGSLTGAAGSPSFASVPDGLAVNLPAAGLGNNSPAASYAFELYKAGTGIANLLQLEISALEAEGKGKVIASPRLITSNQKEAHIEEGQERIFTTSVLGVGSVVTKKAVLSLTVTPQITPDDRVIMDVFVTQDSFVSATEPTINTKQVKTQVLLGNGETAVIGGIYQEDQENTVTKVPILGDIPGLGILFRNKSKHDNRTELLIFLTPRIINPALNLGALNYAPLPVA